LRFRLFFSVSHFRRPQLFIIAGRQVKRLGQKDVGRSPLEKEKEKEKEVTKETATKTSKNFQIVA
jgi:hypothetical protein